MAGAAAGFVIRSRMTAATVGSAEQKANALLEEAKQKADVKAEEIRQRAEENRLQAEREATKLRSEIGRLEKQNSAREAAVDQRSESLDQRERKLETREQKILEREKHVDTLREEISDQVARAREALEKVAGMSQQDAKDLLIKSVEEDAKRDALALVRDFEARAREEAERRARKIVVTAIQRLGAEQAQESSTSVVQLPNEDMKGRIIGREGRNIRHFEQVTGANLIVDESPETVVLSCFDPVRREVARLTLDALISDGRIHPARIEEQYERARGQIEKEINSAGEEAIHELGITNVHPELVRALGRLRFR